MATVVYFLCALMSGTCAVLLLKRYLANKSPLLFWAMISFSGLFLSNLLLVLDFVYFPSIDLYPVRAVTTLASLGFMIFGFIWEVE
jgi:hypothetical protein